MPVLGALFFAIDSVPKGLSAWSVRVLSRKRCNNCVFEMLSKRDREADDEGTPGKAKRLYRQTYKKEYGKEFPTIKPSSKGENFAFCIACRTDINIGHSGRYDCKKHCDTQAHKTGEKALQNGSSMLKFVGGSSSSSTASSLENDIARAEAKICLMAASLNLSMSATDVLTKMMPHLFPDSKIAKGEWLFKILFLSCNI